MRVFKRLVLFIAPMVAVIVVGCGGGVTTTPVQGPNVTDPNAPFSVTQSAAVASGSPQLSLPSGGAFGGTLTLPGAVVSGSTTLTETLTNIHPAATPVLQDVLRAGARSAETVVPNSQYVYLVLTASQTFTTSTPPVLAFALPAADVAPGSTYYLAEYDPTQPAAGWQQGFAGPGTIAGSTITFTPSGGPFTFTSGVQYDFGLYVNTGTAPPQRVIVTTSSPTQTLAGTTQTFSASEVGYGGAFGASAACVNGANSTGTVGTATPASATPTAAGGSVQFTFTALNAGTCTITVTGASGTPGTIQYTVSATNLGVN